MRVRPLRDLDDTRALLIAHGRAWEEAYSGIVPEHAIERVATEAPDHERITAEYDRLTEGGDGVVLVVEDDAGSVRGYAVFRWGGAESDGSVRDEEAELKELYVDPACWGEGMGTRLLEVGIEQLPEAIDSLALETLEGNDVGTGFYEARGFRHDGNATFEIDGASLPTRVYRKSV